MAAALLVPISGPYVGVWDSLPIGTLSDDGYMLIATIQGQPIAETDAFGMTLVEGIYRGQNWRCRIRGLEWKAGLLAILQAFGGQTLPAAGELGPLLENIGDRYSAYSAPMVLTAILGDPPTVPQSLTATNAVIAPNQESSFMMTSKMRELPLELVFLPYQITSGSETMAVPFTVT